MLKKSLITLARSVAVTLLAVGTAVVFNAIHKKGIPLVADVPYEIFAPCKDAESSSATLSPTVYSWSKETLVVDASPKSQFENEHVQDAVNVPYSALFGASAEDIAGAKRALQAKKASRIVVYGTFSDPNNPSEIVDFAKPLADQLTESGLKEVGHIEGGINAMKKQGAPTVKGR